MLISLLLIFCLPLFKLGECDFLDKAGWRWRSSCLNHPWAVRPGIATDAKDIKATGKQCNLTFSYTFKLGPTVNKDQEARDFCALMYPDYLSGFDWGEETIDCNYFRNRKCSDPKAYEFGMDCVKVHDTPLDYAAAKAKCDEQNGSKLINIASPLIRFFSRLYSFDQPTPYVWAQDSDSSNKNVYLLYTQYSAIGSKRIGAYELQAKTDQKKKATVICVGQSESSPDGKSKITYCELYKFFNIHAHEIGKTCYSTTQSVMTAKHNMSTPKVVTVDHFNDICRARYGDLNSPVAPISNVNKAALQKASLDLKCALLLPGSLTVDWDAPFGNMDPGDFSLKEQYSSKFAYKVSRKVTKGTKDAVEIESMSVMPDMTWANGFPRKMDYGGLLLWNKQRMENTFQYRRAPILCAGGPSMVPAYKCDVGWEIAHREKSAICFKAFKSNELSGSPGCPPYGVAKDYCKDKQGGAKLAPMESPEEEMAITRSVTTVIEWRGFDVSAVLGGVKIGDRQYKWEYDDQVIGRSYYRWMSGNPDHHQQCKDRSAWQKLWGADADCIYEECVDVRFRSGKSVGLNDVTCVNPCRSNGDAVLFVCAKEAVFVPDTE